MTWFFPLEHVKQEDWDGCVTASVAIVCGVSYKRARSEMFGRNVPSDKRATDKRAIAAIARMGFRCRHVDDFRTHRVPSIVSFQWDPKQRHSYAHAVVWDADNRRFIDPANANGYVSPHEEKRFISLWERTNWKALIVEGRLSRPRPFHVDIVTYV